MMQIKEKITLKYSIFFVIFILLTTNININIAESIPENTTDLYFNSDIEYRAILIGNNYLFGGNPLPYSYKQMMGFKTTLLNGGNWKESNIRTISSVDVTKTNIVNEIEWLAENADETDVSIFYFIGHGGQGDGKEYLVLNDVLLYDYELDQLLSNVSGNLIVILDACYSGGFIEELRRPGRTILTACAKNEKTYQIGSLESGLFGFFFNLSVSWFAKRVEIAYLLTRLFTTHYTNEYMKEHDKDISISPQIYDGITGMTRMIYRHRNVRKTIALLLNALRDIAKETTLWIMEEESQTPDTASMQELVLDQKQENHSFEAAIHHDVFLAQSFTPSMSPLTRIEFKINKPRRTDTGLVVSIREQLDGSDLTSNFLSHHDIPFFTHWIGVDINDLDVEIGKKYYIMIRSTTSPDKPYRWLYEFSANEDIYTDGQFYRYFPSSNVWETIGTETQFMDATFRTYSYKSQAALSCQGFLNWTDVQPGQDNLTGSFTIRNVGTPYSRLNWSILSWPYWGTWEFSLHEGNDLKPEDGPITVFINVEAPQPLFRFPNTYDGRIIIVNEDDHNETCVIQAYLATPKSKSSIVTHHHFSLLDLIWYHLFYKFEQNSGSSMFLKGPQQMIDNFQNVNLFTEG